MVVSARDLHFALESKQEFANWIKGRISKYGFVENQDYSIIISVVAGTLPRFSALSHRSLAATTIQLIML